MQDDPITLDASSKSSIESKKPPNKPKVDPNRDIAEDDQISFGDDTSNN